MLTHTSKNVYSVFPVTCPDLWEMYLLHEKLVWIPDEVDLSQDLVYWQKMSANEQYFIKHVLAFFSGSDGIVIENLMERFIAEVQVSEARAFYTTQMYMEMKHSIMYGRLLETYVTDAAEKDQLFNAITSMPCIATKGQWALQWINSDKSFATRLVAFAIVEGVFFSGSFCAIYWLKERGSMPGLCMSNDFIARDEGLHTDFAVLLYTRYVAQEDKLSQADIEIIVRDAVRIEQSFVCSALPCSLLGMNSTSMAEYIEFVANRLVRQLGYADVFSGARQPFAFMERICLESSTNFFDRREVNYQKSVQNDHMVAPTGGLQFDADF